MESTPDVVVVVFRDPEWSNEFFVEPRGYEVEIHDVDFGRADLDDPEEAAEFYASHAARAEELRKLGFPEAANAILSAIADFEQ
jgi:hypothetical protein